MVIEDNILRHYLKDCYFITGTAYAGKSTMCRMLAERYGLIHCEENYNMDEILSVVEKKSQPDFCYFHEMASWQEYVSRTPDEFERWFNSVAKETTGFEIAELIRRSARGRVIVDTNISCGDLWKISDWRHVAVMLSPPEMAVEKFFDRNDEEKRFLLSEIEKCPEPEKTLENFKSCIARINSRAYYDRYAASGFFTVVRTDTSADTREETLAALAEHFCLDANPG